MAIALIKKYSISPGVSFLIWYIVCGGLWWAGDLCCQWIEKKNENSD